MNKIWLNNIKAYVNTPSSLNLPRATIKQIHFYNPKINQIYVLEKLPQYRPYWLFLNADDKAQVNWLINAVANYPNPKVILTGGSIKSISKKLQIPIYFDQSGVITKKLNIKQVPAIVIRENNQLKITELVIKENGDVV